MYNINIETRSWNHCFRGKTISITYSDCVFVALGIQLSMQMRYILSSAASPLYNIFFPRYLINGMIFGGKKVIELRICLIFCTIFFWKYLAI